MKSTSSNRYVCAVSASLAIALSAMAGNFAAAAQSRLAGNVTPERLLRTDSEPGEWLTHGRDWRQSYYSTLTQINKQNIDKLGFAWAYDIDAGSTFQATPLVVDGVMFTSGPYGAVYAVDAANGRLRWSFKPPVDSTRHGFTQHRGVAVWRGNVYVPTSDGWLYALNAGTGAVVWKVDTLTDRSRAFWITGAPYIAKDLVLVGNGAAEWGTRGYVTAYDTKTGKQAWRFFLVPGDPKKPFEHPEMEMAAKTWDPNSHWDFGGGGNAWDAMSYDPELNLLYVGTGNGGPWNRDLRSPAGGDNLFLSSIVAINPDTGRMAWYYQTTPGDDLDYGASQKMILADLKIGDRVRKVLMQSPKNGFFYVLDRATGELLAAKPIVYTNWAKEVDMKTGRPVETGRADYSRGPRLVFPMESGGHNWQPMSYSPDTGLVYVPVQEAGAIFAPLPNKFEWKIGKESFGVYYRFGMEWEDGKTLKCWPSLDALKRDEPDPRPKQFLRAWDPLQEKTVWEVKTEGRGGVISTAAGLIFQGDTAGHFRVYDTASGALLRDLTVGGNMGAAPLTYTVKGEQYVAIMAAPSFKGGGNTKGRILAFKISGRAVPPPTSTGPTQTVTTKPPVADSATLADITLGGRVFDSSCGECHARGVRAPDLRDMTLEDHQEFLDIVLKGSRITKGMPNFSSVLNEADAKAIQAYVVHLAWLRHNSSSMAAWSDAPEGDPVNRIKDVSDCGVVLQ